MYVASQMGMESIHSRYLLHKISYLAYGDTYMRHLIMQLLLYVILCVFLPRSP